MNNNFESATPSRRVRPTSLYSPYRSQNEPGASLFQGLMSLNSEELIPERFIEHLEVLCLGADWKNRDLAKVGGSHFDGGTREYGASWCYQKKVKSVFERGDLHSTSENSKHQEPTIFIHYTVNPDNRTFRCTAKREMEAGELPCLTRRKTTTIFSCCFHVKEKK